MLARRLGCFAHSSLVASLTLVVSAKAEAFGVVAKPPASARVIEARMAMARGPTRSTAWVQARLEGAADAVLLVVPVPGGAAVDVSPGGWLDALEESTAPRVRPPLGVPPANSSCEVPKAWSTVSSGDFEAPVGVGKTSVAVTLEGVKQKAMEWGFSSEAVDVALLGAAAGGDGARFLLVELEPPVGVSATPTLRLHGPEVGGAALSVVEADSSASVSFTTWWVGDGRVALAGVNEVTVPTSQIVWTTPKTTTYAARREELLASASGQSLVIEVAGAAPLRSTTVLPGVEGMIRGAVDAYLRRASERVAVPFEASSAASTIGVELAKAGVLPDGCPRGDLVAAQGWACEQGAASEGLSPAPEADDLQFVFAGDVAGRWVTRLQGRIPKGNTGPTLAPVWAGEGAGSAVSAVKLPGVSWAGLCTAEGGGGAAGKGGGLGKAGAGGKPGGMGGETGGGATETEASSDDGESGTQVDIVCVGANAGSDEGCDCGGQAEGADEGDGCDGGDEVGESTDDAGSCDGGESSGEDGGASCDGGSSEGGGESCSGGDGDCRVSGRASRGRSKLSRWVLLLAAVALPLRRWRRPSGGAWGRRQPAGR